MDSPQSDQIQSFEASLSAADLPPRPDGCGIRLVNRPDGVLMVLPERPFLYPRMRAVASLFISLFFVVVLYALLNLTLVGADKGDANLGLNIAVVAFSIAVVAASINLKSMLARDELILAPAELDYHKRNRTVADFVSRRDRTAARLGAGPGWAFFPRKRVRGVEPPGDELFGPVWIHIDAWDESSGKRAITDEDTIYVPLGHALRAHERKWLCQVIRSWLATDGFARSR
jgi:hypothetical protein